MLQQASTCTALPYRLLDSLPGPAKHQRNTNGNPFPSGAEKRRRPEAKLQSGHPLVERSAPRHAYLHIHLARQHQRRRMHSLDKGQGDCIHNDEQDTGQHAGAAW